MVKTVTIILFPFNLRSRFILSFPEKIAEKQDNRTNSCVFCSDHMVASGTQIAICFFSGDSQSDRPLTWPSLGRQSRAMGAEITLRWRTRRSETTLGKAHFTVPALLFERGKFLLYESFPTEHILSVCRQICSRRKHGHLWAPWARDFFPDIAQSPLRACISSS